MFGRINRRLAILAKEIEASRPKTVSFKDFETKVFPYPTIKERAAGTLTPRALRDLEQAAFEVWLADESPSGDVESVQRQWEVSDAYADFLEAHAKPVIPQPASPEVDGEGWVKWEGGVRPFAKSQAVAVRFRNGKECGDRRAGGWHWVHSHCDDDIVAYKVLA